MEKTSSNQAPQDITDCICRVSISFLQKRKGRSFEVGDETGKAQKQGRGTISGSAVPMDASRKNAGKLIIILHEWIYGKSVRPSLYTKSMICTGRGDPENG